MVERIIPRPRPPDGESWKPSHSTLRHTTMNRFNGTVWLKIGTSKLHDWLHEDMMFFGPSCFIVEFLILTYFQRFKNGFSIIFNIQRQILHFENWLCVVLKSNLTWDAILKSRAENLYCTCNSYQVVDMVRILTVPAKFLSLYSLDSKIKECYYEHIF